jgi:hypothetical protein
MQQTEQSRAEQSRAREREREREEGAAEPGEGIQREGAAGVQRGGERTDNTDN